MAHLSPLGDLQTEFFAPAPSDLIDQLLGEYRSRREKIDTVAALVGGSMGDIVHYFLRGNGCDSRGYSSLTAEKLFRAPGAVAALDAAYWSKALALTDVLDCMPQARRDEWNKQITGLTAPTFDADTVRPTLETLLTSRQQFLAERVDGIFRALSGEHVTNSPAAFGKRMIMARVLGVMGYPDYERAGEINDLRCVIAKFMGRDEPKYRASAALLTTLQESWGQWVSVDGGALRIRLYKKGTAHIEVHPEMAWRLNRVLAYLHPLAIPAEHRQRPERRLKDVPLMMRPLPFEVLEVLAGNLPNDGDTRVKLYPVSIDDRAWNDACQVLVGIGGAGKAGDYQFQYPVRSVLTEIVVSGCLPDAKSHQYYPTPECIAREAIRLAEIGPDDICLEPSAGQGGLADFMPLDRTTCVETSELHCKVLDAKGHNVVCANFLTWGAPSVHGAPPTFDKIVMNPPFADGRWQAHLECARKLVRKGGRLVAIVPASAKGRAVLPGFNITWSRIYPNAFAGTSISVVILVGDRK